ncbi:MAG: type II toxin-antitoxin system VapB family antitoxin [Actinomycetes bacterium]
MALNIRNESTLEALRELAAITGRPMTTELESAVVERLARLRTRKADRLVRLQRICQDTAQRWPSAQRSGDLTDALYDDRGIPA